MINIYKNLYSNEANDYDYINEILKDIAKLEKQSIIIDKQYYYEELIINLIVNIQMIYFLLFHLI